MKVQPHILGQLPIECPECANRDLAMGIKGFYFTNSNPKAKVIQVSQPIDPKAVFICTNVKCKNIFDLGDWAEYYAAKQEALEMKQDAGGKNEDNV